MKTYMFIVIFTSLVTVYCSAIPTNEKKQRTHEKSLSDEEHEKNGQHNSDFDHDAFLGHDEAETFDQLSPDESKARLAIIVDKIDENKDGEVTEAELKAWIQYVQRRYIVTDTDRMWRDHEPDSDNTLIWSSYQKRTFGYDDEPTEGSPTFDYKSMIVRDKRRWERADKDNDGKLSKEEFQHFLHPEEAEHMRDIVVEETLEDIDKDGDGFISLNEYIDDIWGDEDDDEDDDDDDEGDDKEEKHHGVNGEKGEPEWVKTEREQFASFRDKNNDGDMWPRKAEEKGEEEPDWVKSERDQFANYRDKNNDGKMDKEEVMEWIIPADYDHSEAEAQHLIFEADGDEDGKLSKEEILHKYDLFVGSQATDFGEALTKHDEF